MAFYPVGTGAELGNPDMKTSLHGEYIRVGISTSEIDFISVKQTVSLLNNHTIALESHLLTWFYFNPCIDK